MKPDEIFYEEEKSQYEMGYTPPPTHEEPAPPPKPKVQFEAPKEDTGNTGIKIDDTPTPKKKPTVMVDDDTDDLI